MSTCQRTEIKSCIGDVWGATTASAPCLSGAARDEPSAGSSSSYTA